MRTIRISEEVWNEIAKQGVFGETPDDVLRRVFNISERRVGGINASRERYATNRMSSKVIDENLVVAFQSGASRDWKLPPRHDKASIRAIKSQAIAFAKENDATIGQVNAVVKALTDAGYYLTK